MSTDLAALTLIHVAISLIGIASGLVVTLGLLRSQRMDGSVPGHDGCHERDGFPLPFHKLLPPHIVGVISLALLAFAITGRYKFQLAGAWRRTYSVTAVLSLFPNVFV